jgi:hypothetical protein
MLVRRHFAWILVAVSLFLQARVSSAQEQTPTPTSTPIPPAASCTGDCNDDGVVAVNELVLGVNIALGTTIVDDCLAMDANGDGVVAVNELVTAVNNALSGCPAGPTVTPTQSPLPTFDAPLGTRRFSLDPATSGYSVVGLPIPVGGKGFEGFIEFEAGQPDAETGLASVAITDASEYLSISVPVPLSAPIVLCLRPQRDLLPIDPAGFIACYGGVDVGFSVIQDHNIGVVGVDGFTEQDCVDAGGLVEPEGGPHPGVCNGPLESDVPPEGDSGAGAMVVGPDPETLEGGFPVILTQETALPCGDEGGEQELELALTSGASVSIVLHRGSNLNAPPFEVGAEGENFSCVDWAQENGPGKLVLAAPIIDLSAPPLGFFDLGNVFEFDD